MAARNRRPQVEWSNKEQNSFSFCAKIKLEVLGGTNMLTFPT